MPDAAAAPSKNSTTVRTLDLSTALLRGALRAGAQVAPGWVDRALTRRFFRPRRRGGLPAPEVRGLPARSFRVETSLGELAAWAWGEGPTALLAHGWEGHAGQWAAMVPALVAEGLRVVAFDMPGHGRSEGGAVTVLDMAGAVREVAEQVVPLLGAEPAPLHAVVAHSLGGAAAALALAQGVRASRAVLLAPVAEPTHFARQAAAFFELPPARTAALVHNVVQVLGGDVASVDVRGVARRLAMPALVFHDRDDREVPFEHGRAIAQAWPGARMVVLEGLGHRRLLKAPEVVEATARFLRDEQGRPA